MSRRISETGQRDQPASVAGGSLGKEMLERNSYVPPNLPGWGRNRGASPSSPRTAAREIWGCRSAVYRLRAPGADELVGAGHG